MSDNDRARLRGYLEQDDARQKWLAHQQRIHNARLAAYAAASVGFVWAAAMPAGKYTNGVQVGAFVALTAASFLSAYTDW